MVYFPDLSPFTYSRKPKCGQLDVVSVGWLDGEHNFSTGKIDPERWAKFEMMLKSHAPIYLTRGKYVCELCGKASGNGEVHAYHPHTKKIYVAPALILHYIQAHQYLPPEEFIEAVFHKLLKENDCTELESLYDALDFGMNEERAQEKINQILGI